MSKKQSGYTPPANMKGSGMTPTPKVPASPRIYSNLGPSEPDGKK
jgi:hypothetical protein